jgi:S-adenosylmethionine synthetase
VQVAYAIGVARPMGVYVNSFGTGRIEDEKLASYIAEHFDFRPRAIIETLDLLHPIYRSTASYGHFGRPEFSWERADRAEEMAADLLGKQRASQNGSARATNGGTRQHDPGSRRSEPAPRKAELKKKRAKPGRTGDVPA